MSTDQPPPTGNWCKCGKEMDPLASRMNVCSDNARNKIRNTMDRKVCESLKKIAKPYFREMDMDLINGEPLCAEYLTLKDGVVIQDREEDDDRNTGPTRERTLDSEGDEGRFWLIAQHLQLWLKTSRIFFFAVATSGGLRKEAREFVKLLAKMSGGNMSRIDHRLHFFSPENQSQLSS
jgi:hypothetical protein